jgi:hypothetical protein
MSLGALANRRRKLRWANWAADWRLAARSAVADAAADGMPLLHFGTI